MSAIETAPLLTGLPPLVDDRSRLLILGSFPSAMSLAKQEYYGNPQNHFWPVMEALFGIDRHAPYVERTSMLLAQGVAVWDVIAECAREGSGDDRIQHASANRLVGWLREYPRIRHVAFNGGAAHATARALVPDVLSLTGVQCERLPSTRPRHARMRLAEKAAAWGRLKEWLTDGASSVRGQFV